MIVLWARKLISNVQLVPVTGDQKVEFKSKGKNSGRENVDLWIANPGGPKGWKNWMKIREEQVQLVKLPWVRCHLSSKKQTHP